MLRGDWLYVCERGPEGQTERTEYQGFVHEVRREEVALGFDDRSVCEIADTVLSP